MTSEALGPGSVLVISKSSFMRKNERRCEAWLLAPSSLWQLRQNWSGFSLLEKNMQVAGKTLALWDHKSASGVIYRHQVSVSIFLQM